MIDSKWSRFWKFSMHDCTKYAKIVRDKKFKGFWSIILLSVMRAWLEAIIYKTVVEVTRQNHLWKNIMSQNRSWKSISQGTKKGCTDEKGTARSTTSQRIKSDVNRLKKALKRKSLGTDLAFKSCFECEDNTIDPFHPLSIATSKCQGGTCFDRINFSDSLSPSLSYYPPVEGNLCCTPLTDVQYCIASPRSFSLYSEQGKCSESCLQ